MTKRYSEMTADELQNDSREKLATVVSRIGWYDACKLLAEIAYARADEAHKRSASETASRFKKAAKVLECAETKLGKISGILVR